VLLQYAGCGKSNVSIQYIHSAQGLNAGAGLLSSNLLRVSAVVVLILILTASRNYAYTRKTERRGRVVNTHVSNSGGLGFKFQPGDRLSWVRFVVVFLSPSRKMSGNILKLGHGRFLPYPFKFIIHVSSFHLSLCSLSQRFLTCGPWTPGGPWRLLRGYATV
jgi:hypothetical protein